jgi:hypothetical protein
MMSILKGVNTMRKIFTIFAAMLIVCMATALACREKVHVQNENGNDMEGVNVRLSSDCGWGPQTDATDHAGWTTTWFVHSHCTYTASVPTPPEGFACDTGTDYNNNDQGEIHLTCTPNEVPEFGLIAGTVALIGAGVGLFLIRKRG